MDPIDDLTLPNETTVVAESATKTDRETPDEKTAREQKEKTLALMRRQFRTGVDAWQHFRDNAIDDARFRAGTWGKKTFQWVDNIQGERAADGRPCLTINRAPSFVHQVTNQGRSAHLRIQVNPVDDAADPKTAEVFQGIVRNIETNSLADWQYARGSDKQAEMGLGLIRVITEWADEESFRQRIRIKGERNPLRVILSPAFEEPDASDAHYAFKVVDLDRGDFKNITGYDPPSTDDVAAFSVDGAEAGEWFPNGKIRLVEWFNLETQGARKRIALLSNGDTIPYPDAEQTARLKELQITVTRDRWVQPKVMMWRKCSALAIYEETEWGDKVQPWTPVMGDELEIEGERDFRGVIRDSKDAARTYNAEVSGLVEAVGRGIKAPVVGYRGQFGAPGSDQRKAWADANRKPLAFLEVEPIDIDGKPAPMPQPITFEPPLQGVIAAIRQADEDYKTTAGFHDASLGERGPSEAGVAIAARQKQDEHGSSHYLDNLRLALCAVGRRLIPLIRKIYDVPTVLRITGQDDRERKVMVYAGAHNDPRQAAFLKSDPATGQQMPFQLPEGVSGLYDLSVGEFDIEVSAAPNAGTRRQEEFQGTLEILKTLPPQIGVKFIDLWFMLLDTPVGRQMAARAKKLLPPEFQDEDLGGVEMPPQVAAMVSQLKEQLSHAMQVLQQTQQELATQSAKERVRVQGRLAEQEAQLQSNERLEALKLRAKLIEQEIAMKGEQALALLQSEIDRLTGIAQQQHDARMKGFDLADHEQQRQHEAALAAAQAESAAQQQAAAAPPAAAATPDETGAPA